MKNNLIKFLFVLLSIFAFYATFSDSYAQKTSENKPFNGYMYLQPSIGLSQYFGDINPNDLYNKNPKFAFGVAFGYQLSPIFGIRADIMKTKLYSEKASLDKKLSSDLFDMDVNLTININEIFSEYNSNRFANIYLLGGAGFASVKSKLSVLSTGALVQEHSSRQSEFILPFGAGAAFRLSDNLALNLEYVTRYTNKDNVVDLWVAVKKNEWYSYASAGLQIKLGKHDRDKDGVKDKADLCPDVPGKVELAGCPDKDNDGIADKDDACPDVAGKIELQGCPDTDGDGIADKDDRCPTIAGLKEFKGCPDTDGDGIPDIDDRCPTAIGKTEFKGCPDKDGDGIPDIDDRCPNVKGLVALKGCPDQDGDGIADIDDKCPSVAGLAKFDGCPDTDGDGIPDPLDKCPTVAGIAANKGCPEIKAETKKLFEQALQGIKFETNKDVIKKVSFPILDNVVKVMKENPAYFLEINGHTDDVGSDIKNMDLSQRRAESVKKYLINKGVEQSRLTAKGFGETIPVADNKTSAGRAKNRRVEFKVNF